MQTRHQYIQALKHAALKQIHATVPKIRHSTLLTPHNPIGGELVFITDGTPKNQAYGSNRPAKVGA